MAEIRRSTDSDSIKCQIACLPCFFEGYAEVPHESLIRRLRLLVRRNVTARQVRLFKTKSDRLLTRIRDLVNTRAKALPQPETLPPFQLKAGDLVRIRPELEIKRTLNRWGIFKGCMFMPEMAKYCGTVQRVFRVMERFVDERDYRVKKCQGIILLEGLHCQGTSDYGRCDRACFYFWRIEWLERFEDTEAEEPGADGAETLEL
jgi:hypothetical protein